AFTSGFAHFGLWHLTGNALFVLVFGAAAEQKLPRWAYAAFVLGLPPLTALVDALGTADGIAIGGASRAVAGLIRAGLFLQPRARVTFSMLGGGTLVETIPLRVPLWVYGVCWAAVQGLLFSLGVPGVAWLSHLSGFASGLAVGFVFARASRPPVSA